MNEDIEPIKKRNRNYGLIILGIIILPTLAAYIMFKTGWGIPTDTSNKGTLLEPARAIDELILNNENDVLARLVEDNKKRWRILVPVTQPCTEICQNHLYISRQVHIRLAEKAYRVERVLLLLETLSTDAPRNHLGRNQCSRPKRVARYIQPSVIWGKLLLSSRSGRFCHDVL
jgi:hypothetical protein